MRVFTAMDLKSAVNYHNNSIIEQGFLKE